MQQTQCRYAKASVQDSNGSAYLSGIEFTSEPHGMERKMNLIRSYKNWRRYTETVRELSRLNARELDDLGINRADIAKVARAASY
jgi:uncharacterized protein YjiS (DUF1127 family)